jgi:hypothetical protein
LSQPTGDLLFTVKRTKPGMLPIAKLFSGKNFLQEIGSIFVMQMETLWTFDLAAVIPAPRFPLSRRTGSF